MKDLHPDGMRRLIEAIVKSAITDWKSAMRILKDHPEAINAEARRIDCEKFFLSTYFYDLTGMSGRRVLDHLKKEIEQ